MLHYKQLVCNRSLDLKNERNEKTYTQSFFSDKESFLIMVMPPGLTINKMCLIIVLFADDMMGYDR